MNDTVLTSTKKILGLDESYTVFDQDIMTHINSALMVVSQIGIGPEEGMEITSDLDLWKDILPADVMYNTVKTYVYLRVRILFDPPTTSFMITALEDQLREYEWRLNVHRESSQWTKPGVEAT